MDAFSQTLSIVMAICFGIFAVTIFFKIVNYLGSLVSGTTGKILIAQDFVKKDALVTVKLSGAETIDRVKFVGFTKSQMHGKEAMPFPFARMAVFENAEGERLFIPSTTIKFIKEIPSKTSA